MIDFLKIFADQCHHGKEEQILFPQELRQIFPFEPDVFRQSNNFYRQLPATTARGRSWTSQWRMTWRPVFILALTFYMK